MRDKNDSKELAFFVSILTLAYSYLTCDSHLLNM